MKNINIKNSNTNQWIKLLLIIIFFSLTSCGSGKLKTNLIKLDILLDPHRKAPLSALAKIDINHPDAFDIRVTVVGKLDENSLVEIPSVHTFPQQKGRLELPILGLFPDHKNQVFFEFLRKEKTELKIVAFIETKPLATNLVVPFEIYENKLKKEDRAVYLVDNLKVAFDQQGEIRWAYQGDSFFNYGKLKNGNLLITSKKNLIFDYHYQKFYEVSMLGETIHTYDLSDYYGHHDIWEMPETSDYAGDLLVGANGEAPHTGPEAGNDGVVEEDMILLMDRENGQVKKSWDLKKLFYQPNPVKHELPKSKRTHPDDWIHFNSLYYDALDHTIVFSSRHQSAVVKFDFDSGKLVWILADNSLQQWSDEKNNYGQTIADYLLTAVDDKEQKILDTGKINFWPYGQHAAKRIFSDKLKNKDKKGESILMYDNGNFRNFFQYGKTRDRKKSPQFSRAVEYFIDLKKRNIQKIWEFDYQRKFFTIATGSVDLLPNRNRLIGFMWTAKNKKSPRIVEINPNDEIVFDARVNEGKSFYYQIEKFNLYDGL